MKASERVVGVSGADTVLIHQQNGRLFLTIDKALGNAVTVELSVENGWGIYDSLELALAEAECYEEE